MSSAVTSKRSHSDGASSTSYALDGDVAGGTAKSMSKSNTYIIEAIGGRILQYMSAAVASRDDRPVFGVCDELNSFLVFNKLYGQEIVWRDAGAGADDAPKSLPLFSTFHSRQHRTRLERDDFIYRPTFGGYAEDAVDPLDASKRVPQLRPLLMCRRTCDVLAHAGSDFGWRSLLYVNKGDGDPYPTGVVAMEAWLFTMVEREVTSPTTGKTHVLKDGVDTDDLDEYSRRITAIVNYAMARVSVQVAELDTSGAFAAQTRAPRVVDADDDDADGNADAPMSAPE